MSINWKSFVLTFLLPAIILVAWVSSLYYLNSNGYMHIPSMLFEAGTVGGVFVINKLMECEKGG